MKEESFERVDMAGMESFSATAALSVTGHVLVLFLVFMVSSFPISIRNNLNRLPIIQATLVSEKEMTSLPRQRVAAVARKAQAEEHKVVVQPRVVPKASEQKTISAPLPVLSPQAVEKTGGSSSAMSIDAQSVGMASSTGGVDKPRASGSGGAAGTSAVPRYSSNPRPPYPYQARSRGHEGLVVLMAEVRENGRVSNIRLKRSSGYASLDQSALATVRSWIFEPARRSGMAVASVVEIPVRFSLRDDHDD